MEWLSKDRIINYIKKYGYIILAVVLGIFLLAIPEGEEKTEHALQEADAGKAVPLQESLEEILCQIKGAGKVRVLLTEATGEQTYFQYDEKISSDTDSEESQREIVVLTTQDRSEKGLVRRIDPPTYQGAIILCQGADNASVRLAIVEAVSDATGLTTNKISVLKMK